MDRTAIPTRRFHRDEGGQVSFLTVFGAVALALLLGMVMTTGEQATHKVRQQNAADAAALSGGAWIARGLNLTSAANVAQSQIAAGAIVLQSFHHTLQASRPIVRAQRLIYQACMGIPTTSWFCTPAFLGTTFQLRALDTIVQLTRDLTAKLARCPGGLLWKAANLLESLSAFVHSSFFAVAALETHRVAVADGARGAVLLPGAAFHGSMKLETLTLPTEPGTFADLCDPLTAGSPEPDRRGYAKLLGYPVAQGPFRLGRCRMGWLSAAFTGLPPAGPFLMPGIADANRARLCGGATEPVAVPGGRVPVANRAECREGGGTATWRVATVTSPPVEEADACTWLRGQRREGGATPAGPGGSGTVEEELSCRADPPGRRLADGLHCDALDRRLTGEGLYVHHLEVWNLAGLWVDASEAALPEPSAGSGCAELPRPYLLRQSPGAFRFLAIAGRGGWEETEARFARERPDRPQLRMSTFLEETPPIVTYAQVEVYNGLSDDTFTQDWRVRLERATLPERPFQAFGETQLAQGMDRLLDAAGLGRRRLAESFHRINNH